MLLLCSCPNTGGHDVNKLLEDKIVTISRAKGTLTFPANFMLVAATLGTEPRWVPAGVTNPARWRGVFGSSMQWGHGPGGGAAILWTGRGGQKSIEVGDAADVADPAGSAGQMSARAFHRILELTRTIVADPAQFAWADLADCDQIETPHLAEAIQYRPRRMV